MAALISSLPKIGGDWEEVVSYLGPIWIALFTGVVVGWIWRPKWVDSWRHKFVNFVSAKFSVYSSSFMSYLSSMKNQFSQLFVGGVEKYDKISPQNSDYSSPLQERTVAVTRDDLEHLCRLVEVKDGGPAWIQMMDRSTPTMAYQAWRRDAPTGPPQYRSRTVYEDVTPELMRDFFWDDEFRSEWDDMLLKYNTMEECPTTGTMLVHWIRKFPLFCSDREYIIGRRIWESGRSYYCVTKGVPNSVPRRNKPMRVDLYYSSWCIRAVESNRGDGQLTACEVTLFHHEEMGISRELAKLGVKQGMWGAVKKIEPGLRAYQKHRATDAPLSRFAFMAQINTKINADYLRSLETNNTSSSAEEDGQVATSEKPPGKSLPKFLIVGAAVAVACSLDRGLLTKAVIFGVARRFSKVGRTL